MAIFSRRNIQRMLSELEPKLKQPKDLLKRLDSENPDQAIPAEYELALGWAMSQVAEVEIEPSIGGKTPDFLVKGLFSTGSALVEVMALSDDGLSGQPSMERTANIVGGFADSVRANASRHMHFQFLERSDYKPDKTSGRKWPRSVLHRQRLTSMNFKLTDIHKVLLQAWMETWPASSPLRLSGEGTEVVITWKDRVHKMGRVFSSMPSVTHSLTDNPLYERLKEKERYQLKMAGAEFMRCIFLGDAGCRMLAKPIEYGVGGQIVSGKDVINHFLANSSIDLVAVFSPKRRDEHSTNFRNNPRIWHIHCYDKQGKSKEFNEGLEKVGKLLPSPRLHGYQARSWLRQDMLAPQGRGQYKPPIFTSGRNRVTAKISARAIFEMMAGRMSPEEFRSWTTKDNVFERWLGLGYAISDVKFESLGTDHDDDYLFFEFKQDPNASPLELRAASSSKEKGKT